MEENPNLPPIRFYIGDYPHLFEAHPEPTPKIVAAETALFEAVDGGVAGRIVRAELDLILAALTDESVDHFHRMVHDGANVISALPDITSHLLDTWNGEQS